jgi:hypothetical protein
VGAQDRLGASGLPDKIARIIMPVLQNDDFEVLVTCSP